MDWTYLIQPPSQSRNCKWWFCYPQGCSLLLAERLEILPTPGQFITAFSYLRFKYAETLTDHWLKIQTSDYHPRNYYALSIGDGYSFRGRGRNRLEGSQLIKKWGWIISFCFAPIMPRCAILGSLTINERLISWGHLVGKQIDCLPSAIQNANIVDPKYSYMREMNRLWEVD